MTHLVERWGLALEVAGGWDARLLRRPVTAAGQTSHPLLHLANFRLPTAGPIGDFGSHVVAKMRARHALVVLKETAPDLAHRGLYAAGHGPWPLTPAMVNPHGLQRTLPGQAGVQRFFSLSGRAFCLYVVLGTPEHRPDRLAEINGMLAGLRVSRPEASFAAHWSGGDGSAEHGTGG